MTELVYEPETQKRNLWLPRGQLAEGGRGWEFGISRCNLLHLRMEQQQDPPVPHRGLWSVFCDGHTGKNVCVCVWVSLMAQMVKHLLAVQETEV